MNYSMEDLAFDISSFEEPGLPTNFNTQFNQIEQFCTPDSLAASSNYINTLLTVYGYDVPLIFDSTDDQDKCKIVTCIYMLLNDKKKEEKERRELNSTIDKLKKEAEELQGQLNQTKRESRQKEKMYIEAKTKLEANETSHKQRAAENIRLKEEVTKLKNNIQYVKSQYAHETKQHEQELTKTKERLIKLMDNHYKINIAQLGMTTSYQTTEENTTDNDKVFHMRQLYEELLQESTNRERQVREENEHLRASLVKIYTAARRLLESQIQRFEDIKTTERNGYIETAKFRLPANYGGKEAIKYIENLMAKIKEEWESQVRLQPTGYTEEDRKEHLDHIYLLEKTIEDLIQTNTLSKEDFEQKMAIYKRFEKGGFFDTLYPTPTAAYVESDSEDESVDDLNSDFAQFKIVKKKALSDQRKITELATELCLQQEKLKAERLALNQLKRDLNLAEVLNEGSPVQNSSSKPSPGPSRSSDFDRPRKKMRSFLGAPSAF